MQVKRGVIDLRSHPMLGPATEAPAQEAGLPHDQMLQVWLSPAFPVGAFAYSHGLEKAAERDLVRCKSSLVAWLADLIELGSLRNDLILAATAWRAVNAGNWQLLADLAELANAMQPSAERHLEATQQGASFVQQIEASWPAPALAAALQVLRDVDGGAEPAITYPVAVGVAVAAHGIALDKMLGAYALAFIGNLVSAAIRLSIVGQTDGQHAIAALTGALGRAIRHGETATLDDLGTASFRADLISMQHETQHTRLFRS